MRVKHHGKARAIIVGYKHSGTPRLIHKRCEPAWQKQRPAIMKLWTELRPEVFPDLPIALQKKIERYVPAPKEIPVSRPKSHKPFPFPDALEAWVRERLRSSERRKGDVKKWLAYLLRDHRQWVELGSRQVTYQEFYLKIVAIEQRISWERSTAPSTVPPAAPVATPTATETPPIEAPQAASVADDLAAMAATANALVALALQRKDREALQLVLEATSHLLLPPTKTP